MSERNIRLRVSVTERLAAAAEEIFALVENTITEYEEELCCSKEENQRNQQLLDQLLTPRVLLHRTGDVRADTEPSLKPHVPQIKEEPEEQVVPESHRLTLRASMTQWLIVADEDVFALVERTLAAYEEELRRSKEENQRKQQLLDEVLRPHRGTEKHRSVKPTEETVVLEICDDPQIHEAPFVQVIEEDLGEIPIVDVATETPTHSYDDEGADFSDTGGMENIESWQIALNEDIAEDEEKKQSKGPFCAICQKRFAHNSALKQHIFRHIKKKPFSCPVCSKGFFRESRLQSHLKVHPKSAEKRFKCPFCPMMFKKNFHLKNHMYQHTGKRPYGCSVCEESFKRKYELDYHLLNIHNIKPAVPAARKEDIPVRTMTLRGDAAGERGKQGQSETVEQLT